MSTLLDLASVVGALVASILVALAVRRSRPDTPLALSLVAGYGLVCWLQPPGLWLSNLALLAGAGAGGVLLARNLRTRGSLIAFCVTLTIVDLLSFGGGLTRSIIDSYRSGGSELLRYLAFSLPAGDTIRPLVGVGDLLCGSAIVLALRSLAVPTGRATAVVVAGLAVALAVGLAIGGVAALPFIAAATVGFLMLGGPTERRDKAEAGQAC